MSDYHGHLQGDQMVNEITVPAYMKYVMGFAIVRLDTQTDEYVFNTGDSELGMSILTGSCDVMADGQTFMNVGSRRNVFDGLPTGVYVPRNSDVTIVGSEATVALCKGHSAKKSEPKLITPDDVRVTSVGKDNWQREVRIVIGPDGASENLILGETLNPAGNWSGTPPHRHESVNPPEESRHEELYYFKSEKPQGWGVQRFYSPERKINELVYLQEGTVTFIPWGYHQIVAAPGYNLYYLFFLSGVGKELIGCEDPDHCWIRDES